MADFTKVEDAARAFKAAERYPLPEEPLRGSWPPIRQWDGTVIRPQGKTSTRKSRECTRLVWRLRKTHPL